MKKNNVPKNPQKVFESTYPSKTKRNTSCYKRLPNPFVQAIHNCNIHLCMQQTSITFIDMMQNSRLFKRSMFIWNECNQSLRISFVGYLQLFSDEKATTLTSSAFFSYLIYVFLLSTIQSRIERLPNNGYTIIGFFPVRIPYFNVDLDNNVDDIFDADCQQRPTSTSEGTERNVLIFNNALKRSFQSLEGVCIKCFVLNYHQRGL